jgi:hypothetical protein
MSPLPGSGAEDGCVLTADSSEVRNVAERRS